MNEPFYILSIDGGGFRGLFSAHLLQRMQGGLGYQLAQSVRLVRGDQHRRDPHIGEPSESADGVGSHHTILAGCAFPEELHATAVGRMAIRPVVAFDQFAPVFRERVAKPGSVRR